MIKQRIYDVYYQRWCSSINNSPRPETYCLFKHECKLESYLDFLDFRISLTKFRTSSIECGRYINIPRTERICLNCNSNMIENEYHFFTYMSKI
jgi:hypothetical protein